MTNYKPQVAQFGAGMTSLGIGLAQYVEKFAKIENWGNKENSLVKWLIQTTLVFSLNYWNIIFK